MKYTPNQLKSELANLQAARAAGFPVTFGKLEGTHSVRLGFARTSQDASKAIDGYRPFDNDSVERGEYWIDDFELGEV